MEKDKIFCGRSTGNPMPKINWKIKQDMVKKASSKGMFCEWGGDWS
jgi:hypothetical protein